MPRAVKSRSSVVRSLIEAKGYANGRVRGRGSGRGAIRGKGRIY